MRLLYKNALTAPRAAACLRVPTSQNLSPGQRFSVINLQNLPMNPRHQRIIDLPLESFQDFCKKRETVVTTTKPKQR
jgi:hypothetical protein